MDKATDKGAKPEKINKAFPDPEIPEGVDSGEELGEDTPRALSPRELLIAKISEDYEGVRQAELDEVSDEQGSADKAAKQEAAVPEHAQDQSGHEDDTTQPSSGVTDDPLASYIVTENGVPMLRLKVDGVEKSVPLATVQAQFQKQNAGDARLQEAALRNKYLDDRQAQIEAKERELQAKAAQTVSPPSVSTDVSDQDLKSEVQQVISSLFTGSEDDAVEKLTRLIGDRRQAAQPLVDPRQIALEAASEARKILASEAAEQAAVKQQEAIVVGFQAFKTEYADIAGDDNLFRYADGLSDGIAAENPSWTPAQIMLEAGKRTREWVESLQNLNPPSTEEIPGNDRIARKRNLTPMPRSTSARVPTGHVEEAPETPQSIVASMRQARGQ